MTPYDWFRFVRRNIQKGIERAVDDYCASPAFKAKVDDIIRRSPVVRFVKAAQLEMLRVDPKMDIKKAWDVARVALVDFVRSEKIQFGDPRYDWSEDAAIELIWAMEIEYWENAP